MSGAAFWLAQNALVATLMAGLLVLLVRWARPRPALEHALWLLVAAKFVLPPLAVVAVPSLLPEGTLAALGEATAGTVGELLSARDAPLVIDTPEPTAGEPGTPARAEERPAALRSAITSS